MPSKSHSIHLYQKRSVSESIETTLDFMRNNRSVWFRMALAILLPPSIVASLVLLFLGHDNSGIFRVWGEFFNHGSAVHIPLFFLGLWAVYIHVYSLLSAYMSHGDTADTLTVRQMLPFVKGVALRALLMPVVPVLMLYLSMDVDDGWLAALVLSVLLVPLALMPSLFILERRGLADAFGKSVSLGFSAWFHLAAVMAITILLGFYITWSFQVPEILLGSMVDTFTAGDAGTLGILLSFVLHFVLYVLVFFGALVMLSVFILGCAFEYGSISEDVEAVSLKADVDNFENL